MMYYHHLPVHHAGRLAKAIIDVRADILATLSQPDWLDTRPLDDATERSICAILYTLRAQDPAYLSQNELLQVMSAARLDPTDDAAWPLPEGWRWVPSVWSRGPGMADRADGASVWVTDRGIAATIGVIPCDVARALLARWEAGQAPQDHPDGCYTKLGGTRDCNGDGHFMCRSCARYEPGEAGQA